MTRCGVIRGGGFGGLYRWLSFAGAAGGDEAADAEDEQEQAEYAHNELAGHCHLSDGAACAYGFNYAPERGYCAN